MEEYRLWLDSEDHMLPIINYLDIKSGKYQVSSHGYIFDGLFQMKQIYHSTNGNDYIMLETEDCKLKYYQIDLIVGFVFYVRNQNKIPHDQFTVIHLNGNNHDHYASNIEIRYDTEIWKTLTYPGVKHGMYSISNHGRLKRNSDGFIHSPIVDKRYHYIIYGLIQNDGRYINRFAHRLVGWEFLQDNRNFEIDVNHIDGIKSNNKVNNLEWVDRKTNIRHAIDTGLNNINGENSPKAKMTNKLSEHICELLVKYDGDIEKTLNDLRSNNIMNISRWVIEQIKYKKKWVQISNKYFRKDQFVNTIKQRHGLPVLTEKYVRQICESLIKNEMNIYKTFEGLYDEIPGLTESQIYKIKSKYTWKNISKEYF